MDNEFEFFKKQKQNNGSGGQELIDAGSSRWMNVVKLGEPIGALYGAEYAG